MRPYRALWEMMDEILSETCQLLYKHKDKNAFLSLVLGMCTDDTQEQKEQLIQR